jgi:hypothetical protein
MMTLTWFCKYCQTNGPIEIDAPISTDDLCRRIIKAHEKTRTMGGEPWVLLSLENGGTLSVIAIDDPAAPGDLLIATLTTPVRTEYPALTFVVLHVQ